MSRGHLGKFALALALIASASALAHANDEGPAFAFPIEDADPKSSLPTPEERSKQPMEYGYLLMEMTGRGEEALTAKDFSRAARYFEALTVAVPEAAVGYRKLCLARSGAGDFDGAVAPCREATKAEGAQAGDLARLLAALLARPTALGPEEVNEFDQVLEHAEKQGVNATEILPFSCELGLRMRDDARLDGCVTRLEAAAPTDARTASFAWALAMRRSNEASARQALERARAASHDPAKLVEMEAAMSKAFHRNQTWMLAGLGVALVAGLSALLLARKGSQAKTPLVPASR